MSIINKNYNDSFEDYESISWYWWTLHLVMAARISDLSRERKDEEWNVLLRSLGVPISKKRRRITQEGAAH